MGKAVRMYQTGGPEVLVYMEDQPSEPGPGQVRIRHEAIGGNFIDWLNCPAKYQTSKLRQSC
jgi:NADPH2:quinone reductase